MGQLEHLTVIDPLLFPAMRWQPVGAVIHPVMGPVDIYQIQGTMDGPDGHGMTSNWWLNGASPDKTDEFGLKLVGRSDYEDTPKGIENNMFSAWAMFNRNKVMAGHGLAPPVKRMVWVSVIYTKPDPWGGGGTVQDIRHLWGYSVCVCVLPPNKYKQSDGVAIFDLNKKMTDVDLSTCPRDDGPLTSKMGERWKPHHDYRNRPGDSAHNGGLWKGELVCFDWGPHTIGGIGMRDE